MRQGPSGQAGGRREVTVSAWSPVPSPFRLLVPLAGLGGMPSPASSPPINSSSMGDRPATAPCPCPCPVVDEPARAGPRPTGT